jgi:Fe-S-cluster-containing hydrogenase component 2
LSLSPSPLRSLWGGHWFKLICGASYQHLPAIEHLTRVYALAGADCIDLAADPAVIAVARQVLDTLPEWSDRLGITVDRPWLMVSVNDGADPHFRKAQFDPQRCPPDCPRPCVDVCPTQAIVFEDVFEKSGVQSDRCYGCGRCLPVCPLQSIETLSYVVPAADLLPQLIDDREIDALELHTQVGHENEFKTLWETIGPRVTHSTDLQLLAISCPFAPGVLDYLHWIAELIDPLPCPLVWQTDGRPMSGDIGSGTTHTAIRFAQDLLHTDLPGFVQLAGGTNAYTVPKLLSLGLLSPSSPDPSSDPQRKVAGVAYGSYARKLLDPALDHCPGRDRVEDYTLWLRETIGQAQALINPLKLKT